MNGMALTEDVWEQIKHLLSLRQETAGVLLCGSARDASGITLLGRELRLIDPNQYLYRGPQGLEIASDGYVHTLKHARDRGDIPVFVHTHPKGRPNPSSFDDKVDDQLANLFRMRSGQDVYVSCVFGGTPSAPSFTGRVMPHGGQPQDVSRLRVVGSKWELLSAVDARDYIDDDANVFERQVRAFGQSGQQRLGLLRAVVVGAGGTGSAVFEQLVRLGVGDLTLVDFDSISSSNLTRIHETQLADIGRSKAQVLVERAHQINATVSATAIVGSVSSQEVALALRRSDLIFGCTDDHSGRAVLSRLAFWYLIPLIDTGVVITSRNGVLEGAFGRVTTVMPGSACLICRGRIDPSMIRNEMLSPEERNSLIAQGYAPELADPAPSVVPYTTLVASLAVGELLDRLFGIGTIDRPSELIVRFHDRKIGQNAVAGEPHHYCSDRLVWGKGDESPLLGQLWS